MWRVGANTGDINAYPEDERVDPNFIDTEFEEAVLNLDFERAKVLNDARQATVDEDIQRQEEHYAREQKIFMRKVEQEKNEELQRNLDIYRDLVAEERELMEQEFIETEKRQQIEIDRLIDEWKIAREEEFVKIYEMIDEMIIEAQNLARTKAFDAAISARDKAFKMREQKTFPEVVKVDKIYQEQIAAMMERHKREFIDLKDYHELKIQEYKDQLDAKNQYAEDQMALDEACLPHLLMKVVIDKSSNPDAVAAVVKSVSPRKGETPTPNRSRSQNTNVTLTGTFLD